MSEEEYTPADEALDCARQIALTAKTSDFCFKDLQNVIDKNYEDWNVFEFYIELSDGIATTARYTKDTDILIIGADIESGDEDEDEEEENNGGNIIIQMIFKPQDDENEEEEE